MRRRRRLRRVREEERRAMIRSVVFGLEGMGGNFAAWSSLGLHRHMANDNGLFWSQYFLFHQHAERMQD